MNSILKSKSRANSGRTFVFPNVSGVFCLFAIIVSLASAPFAFSATTSQTAVARASELQLAGQFAAAANVLKTALAQNASSPNHKTLAFELDRLHRIRLDFSLTQDALFAALQHSVRDLTQKEFEQWINQGRFDYRDIDGQRCFMRFGESNLFWRYPELNARRVKPEDNSAGEKARLQSCRAIEKAAEQQNRPYVLPKRFDATMTVTADADIAPPGQTIRAWLPIPRAYPYQNSFQIIRSSPAIKQIAAQDSPIRCAYFEKPAKPGEPAEFQLHYRYTRFGVHFDIDPNKVIPFDGKDASITPFIREAPHVVFSPEMRALSKQIVGDEKNPARVAKKIYDWIGENLHYSFAIEYSTIRNISDYVRIRRYGDCGQEAMFFITLCRLNNIPARWQSGWDIFPGQEDIHDWSEIYLAPYGWVPVDPCMGLLSNRYMTTLSPAERYEIHNFYFGGLDQYRMAANCDHSQTLNPPKSTFRSDDVDFQRGELESTGHNIYFNHYSYQLDINEMPAAQH